LWGRAAEFTIYAYASQDDGVLAVSAATRSTKEEVREMRVTAVQISSRSLALDIALAVAMIVLMAWAARAAL